MRYLRFRKGENRNREAVLRMNTDTRLTENEQQERALWEDGSDEDTFAAGAICTELCERWRRGQSPREKDGIPLPVILI